MKYLIIFSLILIIRTFSCSCQSLFQISSNYNQIYCGIENNLFISYEHISKNLILITDNGTVEKKSIISFYWRPNKPGNSKIYLKKIIKSDTVLIGYRNFNVIYIEPEIFINTENKDSITKEELINNEFLLFKFPDNIFPTGDYRIIKFSLIILREGEIIYSNLNNGQHFSFSDKEKFKSLNKSDIIVICNINFSFGLLKTILLKPKQYILK